MLKSKHSGWTWDLKRTPFGPGGGWNPLDTVSDVLGTSGGGGGILGGVEDLGQSIGSGLADVDKFVNRELPGGWIAPAAVAAMIAAPELAPMVSEALAGGIEAGVGQDAFFAALAEGASSSEAVGMGLAAQNAGVALTPEMIAYANASADPIGSINAITGLTPEEFASYTQIIGGPTQAAGFSAGEDLAQLMASHPDLTAQQLQDIMSINYGTDPLLSADAANLAANGYDAATIDQVLGYSYNPSELAGTGIESVAADSSAGLNAKDVLKNLSRAKQLANLLGSSGSMIKAAKLPTQQQWQTQATSNLAQATPQQFGGLYEMNKNPFTFQNPLAGVLAGGNKVPAGYDVSGQQGTTLNTDQQNKIYSSLLRS
jgi:hypothetical protein